MQITTDDVQKRKKKKKESSGRLRWPTAKVKQAVHDQEETVQHRDARAQKDRECHHRRHLREEGSENEDDENSDEGWDIEEDGLDDDDDGDEGTCVGRPISFFFVRHTDRISHSV